jgi:hypothetical protein
MSGNSITDGLNTPGGPQQNDYQSRLAQQAELERTYNQRHAGVVQGPSSITKDPSRPGEYMYNGQWYQDTMNSAQGMSGNSITDGTNTPGGGNMYGSNFTFGAGRPALVDPHGGMSGNSITDGLNPPGGQNPGANWAGNQVYPHSLAGRQAAMRPQNTTGFGTPGFGFPQTY